MTITDPKLGLIGEDHPVRYEPHVATDFVEDERVNRPPNLRNVEAFRRFGGGLVVSGLGTLEAWQREDGALVPLDGLHRITLAKQEGYAGEIMTKVHEGIDVRHAAALFRLFNFRFAPGAIQDYLKAVTQGDPEAIAIDAVLARFSLHVEPSPSTHAITCVEKLRRIYRGRKKEDTGPREDALEAALRAALAAYGYHRETYHAMFIMGLGQFFWRYPELAPDAERVGEKIGAEFRPDVDAVLARAGFWFEGWGGTKPDGVAASVVEAWNKSRTTRRVPRWYS